MSTEITTLQPTPVRPYRDYSSEFKAEAIALYKANGNNALRTAHELGIDEAMIRRWLPREDYYRQLVEQKTNELAAKAEYNAHRLADSIADHDLSDVPLAQKATAMGIMVDKMQLLRGQPTSISATIERQELTVLLQQALDSE